MGFISTILGVFGNGLGSIFSWVVNWWEQKKAAEAAAAQQMNQDIIDHSGDGEKSVGDMTSAQGQIDNLNQQAEAIDKPPAPATPPPPGAKP